MPQAQNGLGVAALVIGILGAFLGLIPFLFWISGVLGLLALILGLVGHSRARKGLATNKGMALAGTILGGIAMAMALAGLIITVVLVQKVQEEEKRRDSVLPAAPTASHAPSLPKPAEPAAFGETWGYKDGVKITVSKPESFEPGPYAIGHKDGDLAIEVKITIVNGSDKPLPISSMLPFMEDADGEPIETMYDSKHRPEQLLGTLAPGKQAEGRLTYSVSPSEKLRLTLYRGVQYDKAEWVGPAQGDGSGDAPSATPSSGTDRTSGLGV
ncbi:DUF4190 domain-containing protein [Kitasatospora sp. HPMI-4]|uniref:DUF4190 domain-containing protein n=1 Tax=Kitasatospora sp. HPMI-4 TaxID=3448443 RepID=UPI003F192BB5